MSEEKISITKDTKIGDLLKINEKLGDVLMGFGMHCISCPMSQNETLEEAGMVHGIDIDFLVKKLNEENK
ncbi:MAG: DUF1858 domain-containing protein [Clostridia bacterium]|nr:DUF1858 domain-containing protein [Clostridia bacterium]